MRRIAQSARSIDLLRTPRASSIPRLPRPYLCASCQFSTSRTSQAGDFTEKLRGKIWGNNPPGPDNVYGEDSFIGQRQKERQAKKALKEAEREAAAAEEAEYPEDPEITMAPSMEAAKKDPNYEPAETWEELEWVGDEENDVVVDWGYQGFMRAQRATDNFEIQAMLHRAVVEALVMKEAGKDLAKISLEVHEEDLTTGVQVVPSEDGKGAELVFPYDSARDDLLALLTKEDETAVSDPTQSDADVAEPVEEVEEEVAEPSEEDALAEGYQELQAIEYYKQQVSSWDSKWLDVSIAPHDIRFAVLKRAMQLTGIRVPDEAINNIRSAKALLGQLCTKPEPKKLAQTLTTMHDIKTLPNVKVFDRRVTQIDRERQLGRWKVIEKELEKRGLPVAGYQKDKFRGPPKP